MSNAERRAYCQRNLDELRDLGTLTGRGMSRVVRLTREIREIDHQENRLDAVPDIRANNMILARRISEETAISVATCYMVISHIRDDK